MLPEIKLMYVCMNVGTMYVEIGQYRVYDPTAPAVAWTCRACRGYKRKKIASVYRLSKFVHPLTT